MKVVVKAYSLFKDYIGEEVVLEFDDEITVEELLRILKEKYKMPENVQPIVIVNSTIVEGKYVLRENTVVHITPPFSGGSSEESVKISVRFIRENERVDLNELFEELRKVDPRSGALSVFIGFVKGVVDGNIVQELEYTAVEDAALLSMERIAREEAEKHGLRAVAIWHRVGRAKQGDITLIVASVADSRRKSMKAVEEIVERVKSEVPVFKLEKRSNGDYWIIGDGKRVPRLSRSRLE
ncbi:MAG: molybdenum cofactor biosynthesis protein MoaE [Desulfurococcaceae archaeon]